MSAQKKLIRQQFREAIFKRDRNRCVICKTEEGVDIHHITDRNEMPGGGYVRENGICLCREHLALAEQYLHCEGEIPAELEPYSPHKLYLKIGSNYEKALKASERLERH